APRDQNLGLSFLGGHDELDATVSAEAPDDGASAPLQNLGKPTLAPASPFADVHSDPVSVPERAHFERGQIDILPAVIGSQEPEPVAMRLNGTRHHVEVADQAVLSGTIEEQLSVADHRPQAVLERTTVGVRAY